MTQDLTLLIIVVASYLAARVAFDWLGRRFLVVSGAEYLLLGILLGPQLSGVLSPAILDSFAPLSSLTLGWMGALIGSRLWLGRLVRVPSALSRVAVVESCLTLTAVSGAMTYVLHWHLGLPLPEVIAPAIALGAIAVASAAAGISMATRQLDGREVIVRQLGLATTTNAAVAVLASGILLAMLHPTTMLNGRPLTATEWAVISGAIGVVGGMLFHLFLGDERKVDRLFIALAGAIILVTGAAAYLRLSPLLSAMCFGVVLINTTRIRSEILAALERVERPFYFGLLIFGGAWWQPSTRSWLLPVLFFFALRAMCRIGSARLAARWNGMAATLGPDWGRGLLGQGGLAVAVALSYVHQDNSVLPNVVLTAALGSVLLTDLFSARFVRSLLAQHVRPPEASVGSYAPTPAPASIPVPARR